MLRLYRLGGAELLTEHLIAPFPRSPWATPDFAGLLVETSRKGLLCLPGFLAKWAYTTAVEPRRTLAYAYYLGCGFVYQSVSSVGSVEGWACTTAVEPRRTLAYAYYLGCEFGELFSGHRGWVDPRQQSRCCKHGTNC